MTIRHVVAFRLRSQEPANRAVDAQTIKDSLESLRESVPEILNIHVGVEIGDKEDHWDVVLISDFADIDMLERYQRHAEHVTTARAISPLIEARAIVDYEVPSETAPGRSA